MNLKEFGGLEGGCTVCLDKDGYENVLVVAKGTFDIREDGSCVLAEQQQPVAVADEHYGDPATSSIRYECDFSLHKPFADVVVNGEAHAPSGRLASEVLVGLAVSNVRKLIRVVGDRVWKETLIGRYRPSDPQPFERMPLVYERSFGGADTHDPDPSRHAHERRNLVGVSFFARERGEVVGTPLPNLEHPDDPITVCTARPQPVGFGFLSRNWLPRVAHAGTYDQKWRERRFPLLPEDFDDAYFQGAPADQRCPHLRGGEGVVLTNMTSEGRLEFAVPRVPLSMYLVFRSGHESLEPKLDTLILEPSVRRCILVWRAAARLTRKLTDIFEVWVGTPSRGRLIGMRAEKRYINWMEEAV